MDGKAKLHVHIMSATSQENSKNTHGPNMPWQCFDGILSLHLAHGVYYTDIKIFWIFLQQREAPLHHLEGRNICSCHCLKRIEMGANPIQVKLNSEHSKSYTDSKRISTCEPEQIYWCLNDQLYLCVWSEWSSVSALAVFGSNFIFLSTR